MKKLLISIFLLSIPSFLIGQTLIPIDTQTKNNLPAARVSGQLSSANMPVSAVQTDQANTFGAFLQDFSSAKFKPPTITVASLLLLSPSANLNNFYEVVDGVSSSDCSIGGGGQRALCVSNGTSWVSVGGGGNLAFNQLTTGQNNQATMTLGSGSTLNAQAAGSEIVDFSNVAPTSFSIPAAVSASPTADGQIASNKTTHYLVFGSNGSTFNAAVWGGDIGGNTALVPFVTATHLASALPPNQGGTGITDLTFSGNTHKVGTTSGTLTSGDCVKFDASGNLVDFGAGCGGGGGSPALSSITPAIAANSINNGNNPQTWNFSLTTNSTNALVISENVASTATSADLVKISTLSGSTLSPFQADNAGNGVIVTPSGTLQKLGTGHVNADQCNGVACGTVTSVAETFTGGLITVGGSPISGSGTLALTVAGTSGGIPYFNTATSWASSAALTAHGVVLGEGAGAAPLTTSAGASNTVLLGQGATSDPAFGAVPNAALVNSSVTINTTAPLTGGGALALGGTLSLTCPNCANGGVNSQTVSYSLVAGDAGKNVVFNGNTLTATLPNPPPSATWTATISNLNATALTISRNTLNINGAATNISLPQFQAVSIWTDGTNYFTDTPPVTAGTGLTLTPTASGQSIALTTPVSIANGGTGQTSQSAAATAILPSATTAGTLLIWTGSAWSVVPGNTVGTNFLQENASGTASWASGTSSIAWSAISNPTGALTLSMGTNTSTFNTTSAVDPLFVWANTTAATSSVSQSSPTLKICGQGWEGGTPANVQDCWKIQTLINNGQNASSFLAFTNTGSSTGLVAIQAPAIQTNGTSQGMLALTASTTAPSSFPANSYGWLAPNSATIATPWFFQPSSTTGPAATGAMLVGAVSSNISAISYSTLSGNTTVLGTTSGTLTSGHVTDFDAGGNLIDSGLVASNVTTASANFVSGNVVQGAGANKTLSDSGVAVSNLLTAAANFTNGDLVQAAGANKTTSDSGIAVANVTQNSVTGTTNAIPKWSGAHTLTNSALSDNGTLVSSSESLDLVANAQITEVANAGTTGTTVNKLAKLTGAPSTAVIAATTDTNNIVGIVVGGAGTTGSAQIAIDGQASCVFDGATTAGDYVQVSSTTAGDCHDAGSGYPTSGQVLGRVLTTNAAGGTFAMVVYAGTTGFSPGGGSGTVNSGTAGQIAWYASSTTAVSGNANLTISGGAVTVGIAGSALGSIGLSGNTSGVVTIQPQAAAGTYNFNLPTTAGSGGQLLTSQGGGTSAMTWTSPSTTVAGNTCTLGSSCSISLDQLNSLAASKTFGNGNNTLTQQWAQTTASQSAITFTESSAATGSGDIEVNINTLASSTAAPIQVTARGTANGVAMGATNGVLGQIGTGGFGIGSTAHGVVVSEGATSAAVATAAGTAHQNFQSGGAGADGSFQDDRDLGRIPVAICNNATPGTAWNLPTSGAPTPTCRTGTNVQAGVLQFAASQSAQYQFALPADWDTAANPFVRIDYTQANATASQTIAFQIQIGCSSTTDDPSFATAQAFTTTTTGATANTPYTQTLQLNSTSMTGCSAGGLMNIKLSTTAGSTATANLQNVVISTPIAPNAGQAN